MTIPVFALKIEDGTSGKTDTKTDTSATINNPRENKQEKKPEASHDKEKSPSKENNKNNSVNNKKKKALFKVQDKNETYINDITPKADESGRVFIIPGIDYSMSFSSEVGDLLIFGSDVEYLTEYLNEKLAIYGNLGFGFIDEFFLLHIEGGLKYNLPRLTRFMKPFIKLGLTLNPYFTSSIVYTPIAATTGLGFKFFINSKIAIEQTNELQIGNQVNNSTFYMSMRFKLSAIFIF